MKLGRHGVVVFKKFQEFALGTTFYGERWVVIDLMTNEEFRLTDECCRFFKEESDVGKYVKYEVIRNHGMDPYDNQIPGIDYYDAAHILKFYNKKETREIKLKCILK